MIFPQRNQNRHDLSPIHARVRHHMMSLTRKGSPKTPDTHVERFISMQHNLVAAPIPKVASRSIRRAMWHLDEAALERKDLGPEDIRKAYPDAFVFSLTRNPWDRVYSCWKDKINNAISRGKVRILARFPGLYPFMPFEEFLEWLETDMGSDARADRHWLSQRVHLGLDRNDLFCDYIGRLEDLDMAMVEISRRSGVHVSVAGAVNAKKGLPYQEAFSERARQIVERRYAGDIETFKYRFGG